jgi:hypothetical protein
MTKRQRGARNRRIRGLGLEEGARSQPGGRGWSLRREAEALESAAQISGSRCGRAISRRGGRRGLVAAELDRFGGSTFS